MYYATVKDGNRSGFLAGPFRTHGAALAAVPAVKRLAQEANHRAHFYAFGTARIGTPSEKRGLFNGAIGYSGPGMLP